MTDIPGSLDLLPEERRNRILDRLRHDGRVVASELAALLAVSEDTVRRDLRDLARAGLVQRVHGGALPCSPAVAAFPERWAQASEAKCAVASMAATLVGPGQLVLIDGGTTTLQVARALPPDLAATIVTNSPHVALALADHPGTEVVLLGGRLHKRSRTVVGAEAVEQLRSFRPDLCLLGVCSLDPDFGITTVDLEEAPMKRAMIAQAAETVALATGDKLGTTSPYFIGPIDRLARLVVDAGVPDALCASYRSAGVEIVRAEPG